MLPLLFVIDEEFSKDFLNTYKATEKMFVECYVVTTPDVLLGTRTQIDWSQCVDLVASECRAKRSSLVLVLGHKGIFRRQLDPLDTYKFEARVPAAEKQLREKLGSPEPAVYVSGFHHEPDSETFRLLSKAKPLERPGAFNRLRAIAEEGGGPLGRLSVLKHELLRPFTSARLMLQMNAETGAHVIDRATAERISAAIENGRTQLAGVAALFQSRSMFNEAVKNARSLFEQDVKEITADPTTFNGWIDKLNDALDELRQEAR